MVYPTIQKDKTSPDRVWPRSGKVRRGVGLHPIPFQGSANFDAPQWMIFQDLAPPVLWLLLGLFLGVETEAPVGKEQHNHLGETRSLKGAELPSPQGSFQKGALIGDRYRVLETLGQGATGVVYKVRDRLGEGIRALKMARADLLKAPGSRDQFIREYRIAKDLKHSHLVSVDQVAVDPETEQAYFTMDFLEGGDLNFLLEQTIHRKGSLPIAQVLNWMGQVAEALAYLHHHRLVHQDIKPANILLTREGNAKLGDFGLAFIPRSESFKQRLSQTSIIGGTTYFMSPEQHRAIFYRRRVPITPASDVCAFGLTLYNLISGEVIVGQREPIEEFLKDPDLCQDLNRFLDRCLARKAEQRFPNGEDLLIEFRRIMALVNHPKDSSHTQNLVNKLKRQVFSDDREAGETAEFPLPGSMSIRAVWIPPGRFMMGEVKNDRGLGSKEKPHEVTISSGFWMSETPVTQAQWMAVMKLNPSFIKGKHHPVEMVSWHDARAFVQALNQWNGKSVYRLPSEAEWEYACRGGHEEVAPTQMKRNSWHKDNAHQTTHKVKGKRPNHWGLYDMLGNVWEWCQDWYGPYHPSQKQDPGGPHQGEYKVVRGGSWAYPAHYCHPANRHRFTPENKNVDIGFRLVRTDPRFS